MVFISEIDKLRVIDYERNVILYPKDGVPFGKGRFFELHWGENIIEFGAYLSMEFDKGGKATLNWKIFQYRMPRILESKHDDVRNLIYEALDAFGYAFTRASVTKVNVEVLPHVHDL
jgi:hypothetical protein